MDRIRARYPVWMLVKEPGGKCSIQKCVKVIVAVDAKLRLPLSKNTETSSSSLYSTSKRRRPSKNPPHNSPARQYNRPRKPRGSPNTTHDPNRQQRLGNRPRRGQFKHNPQPLPTDLLKNLFRTLLLRPSFPHNSALLIANPTLFPCILLPALNALIDPFPLAHVLGQQARVVEYTRKDEQWDDGCDLVQDQEGGDVAYGRGVEGR